MIYTKQADTSMKYLPVYYYSLLYKFLAIVFENVYFDISRSGVFLL